MLTVLLVAAVPLLIHLFTLVGNWPQDQIALAVVFGYWCVPQVFFYGLFAVVGDALTARGQFAAFGWAPVANNIISIVGFGAFVVIWGTTHTGLTDVGAWTTGQTVLLAGTATLGIVVQALLLVVALRRGGYHWHLRLGLRGLGLRSASNVVGWTIGAVALEQVGVIYLKNVTSAAGNTVTASGAIAAGNATFTNALTIYLLPHSLLIVSIVTALFPRMSAAATAGDVDRVRGDMSTGLRLVGVFSIFSAAVLMVLAAPLMKALLPTVNASMVEVGAPVLRALAPGLIALAATVLVKRMYYAFGDGRSIFVIQILATLTMTAGLWACTRVLTPSKWTVAAAVATTVSTWISVLARASGMRRKLGGMDGRRVLQLYVRAGFAALRRDVGSGGRCSRRSLPPSGRTAGGARSSSARSSVRSMAVVYGVMLRLTRVEELDDALGGAAASAEEGDDDAAPGTVTEILAARTGTDPADWFLVFKARYGMEIVFRALRDVRGPGEVVTQIFTCSTAVDPILVAGLTPVYGEVSPASISLDPDRLVTSAANPRRRRPAHVRDPRHGRCRAARRAPPGVPGPWSSRTARTASAGWRATSSGKPLADVSIHSFGVEKMLPTRFGGAIWVSPSLDSAVRAAHRRRPAEAPVVGRRLDLVSRAYRSRWRSSTGSRGGRRAGAAGADGPAGVRAGRRAGRRTRRAALPADAPGGVDDGPDRRGPAAAGGHRASSWGRRRPSTRRRSRRWSRCPPRSTPAIRSSAGRSSPRTPPQPCGPSTPCGQRASTRAAGTGRPVPGVEDPAVYGYRRETAAWRRPRTSSRGWSTSRRPATRRRRVGSPRSCVRLRLRAVLRELDVVERPPRVEAGDLDASPQGPVRA